MALRINVNGRNISVSEKNGYTIEKVREAVEFVKHAKRRGTKIEDYLNMYNYLKDKDEVLPNCKICGGAKYIAAVENYAKYGYLTLVASGVDPELLNGNKKEDEGRKEEVHTVETQKSTQEASEDRENVTVPNDGDGVVQSENSSIEDTKTDGNTAVKRKNKKVSK